MQVHALHPDALGEHGQIVDLDRVHRIADVDDVDAVRSRGQVGDVLAGHQLDVERLVGHGEVAELHDVRRVAHVPQVHAGVAVGGGGQRAAREDGHGLQGQARAVQHDGRGGVAHVHGDEAVVVDAHVGDGVRRHVHGAGHAHVVAAQLDGVRGVAPVGDHQALGRGGDVGAAVHHVHAPGVQHEEAAAVLEAHALHVLVGEGAHVAHARVDHPVLDVGEAGEVPGLRVTQRGGVGGVAHVDHVDTVFRQPPVGHVDAPVAEVQVVGAVVGIRVVADLNRRVGIGEVVGDHALLVGAQVEGRAVQEEVAHGDRAAVHRRQQVDRLHDRRGVANIEHPETALAQGYGREVARGAHVEQVGVGERIAAQQRHGRGVADIDNVDAVVLGEHDERVARAADAAGAAVEVEVLQLGRRRGVGEIERDEAAGAGHEAQTLGAAPLEAQVGVHAEARELRVLAELARVGRVEQQDPAALGGGGDEVALPVHRQRLLGVEVVVGEHRGVRGIRGGVPHLQAEVQRGDDGVAARGAVLVEGPLRAVQVLQVLRDGRARHGQEQECREDRSLDVHARQTSVAYRIRTSLRTAPRPFPARRAK